MFVIVQIKKYSITINGNSRTSISLNIPSKMAQPKIGNLLLRTLQVLGKGALIRCPNVREFILSILKTKYLAKIPFFLHNKSMASYHLSGKIFSRSSGRSAVAAAAYRSRSSITDERQGLKFDYSKKNDLGYSAILLPNEAPKNFADRNTLWNEVEKVEKRKDSQVAREIEVALPLEHSKQQNILLVQEYVKDQFVSKGMIADINIHEKSGNPHAHIMLTTRNVNSEGFAEKNRSWSDRSNMSMWRKEWAKIQNQHLSINGFTARVDHRSYQEMGVDIKPQEKIGIGHYTHSTESDRLQNHIDILKENGSNIISNPEIALTELTRHNSTFTAYDLFKFSNSHSYGQEQFREVVAAVLDHDSVVALEQDRYTTQDVLIVEKNLTESVTELVNDTSHGLQEHYKIQTLHGYNLDHSQEKAFENAVSDSSLSVVVGIAGSGKSYMLGAVKDAYDSAGYNLQGIALSGIASNNLQESSGIESKTIFSALRDWEKGENLPTKKDVVVLDEAAMVDSVSLQNITSYVEKGGGKLIAIGDLQQIQSIGIGGGLSLMQEKAGYALMDNVRRQDVAWQKEATQLFSGDEQSVKSALDVYSSHGNVIASSNPTDSKLSLLNDYTSDYGNDTRLIFAHKKIDVEDFNNGVRKILKHQGELGEKDYTFKSRKGSIVLSDNDRIVFLENNNRMGVRNGTLATVKGFASDDSVHVELDSGKQLVFSIKDYNNIDHGYAVTVHKSQGSTVDNSFVYATGGFDKHLSYVAMTRHRNDAKLYYSEGPEGFKTENHLKEALSRDNTKSLAQEFVSADNTVVGRSRIESDKVDIMMLKTGDVKKVFDPKEAEKNGSLIIDHPKLAIDLLSHHQAIFSERDIQVFVHANSESSQYYGVVSAIKNHDEIIKIQDDKYTTRTLLKSENNLFESVESLKEKSHVDLPAANIAHALEYRSLDPGQKDVFDYLVSGDSSIKVVEGIAGTGKSYLLGSVREAYNQSEINVRGVALSGVAAKGLEDGSSITSTTIHRQLFEWDNGKNLLEKNSVLVVDEAGMVGTKQLEALAKYAKDSESKLVLVGDGEQLQSVAAGTPFEAIKDDVSSVNLDDIRRQEKPWQKGATLLLGESGEKYTAEALNLYNQRGNIFPSATKEKAAEKMIMAWEDSYKNDPKNVVMLTSTREDAEKLNSLARKNLQKDGVLDKREFSILNGDDEKVNFAIQDRVIFTHNNATMGVQNGSVGTVTGFNHEVMEVALDTGHTVNFNTLKYNDVAHGYAMTIHKSQGTTVDNSYVLASRQMDTHQTYVGLSRHRKDVQLHYSEEEFTNKSNSSKNETPYKVLIDTLSRNRKGVVIRDYLEKESDPKHVSPGGALGDADGSKKENNSEYNVINHGKATQTQYNYRLTLYDRGTKENLESKDVGLTLHPVKEEKETKKVLKDEIKTMAIRSERDLKAVGGRVARLTSTEVELDKNIDKSMDHANDRDHAF
jgi:Ti-type conjugative transfer relaxase TraA